VPRNALADPLVLARRLRLGSSARFFPEIELAGERPISERTVDGPVSNLQLLRSELGRGGGKQHLARFGARETYRRAAVLDREAACGHSFVWRERRVSVHHANALQVDVELVGRDLRERGSDALAKLDLAGKDGDSAVGIDA